MNCNEKIGVIPSDSNNKQIRILFTSVGRRVELIQAFKNASNRLGVDLIIYGTDISHTAPALFFCDKQKIVCRINNPHYIPMLLDICKAEHINALIPTIDTDLMPLAKTTNDFKEVGTKVIISKEDKINICRDKSYTADFFMNCGLKTPVSVDEYTKYSAGYPCFIKPKCGSSSINAYKVNCPDDLKTFSYLVRNYIIQPFINGTEYTVDIFCDFEGNPIYITPRERVDVRNGEVLKTKMCQDVTIIEECKRLVAELRPCGAITVQLIKKKATGDNYYIEINPRFGGGAPLSMKAGADTAESMIRLLSGEKLTYMDNAAADGVVYSRFDQSICLSRPLIHKNEIKAVIFDLDDTLYSEKEYVKSGFRAVTQVLTQIKDVGQKLWNAFENRRPAIDTVLSNEGIFSVDLKERCLDVYRNHTPDIKLYDGVSEMLMLLRGKGIATGIITDGRPNGQKQKAMALDLYSKVDEIIITDELGGIQFRKPNDIAFRIMKYKLGIPFSNMIYVGDNLEKDFYAPKMLGMQSVYFNNTEGLYREDKPAQVDFCLDSICDIRKYLLGE